jgi:hypothetical protein
MKVQTPMGEMNATSVQEVQLPDKLRLAMQMPMGTIEQGFDGKTAWVRGPMGAQELPASEADDVRQDLFLDPVSLMQASDLRVQYLGEEAGTTAGWLLRVQDADEPAKAATLKVAKDGSQILEMRYRATGDKGPEDVVDAFSDWRVVDGVLFAFKEDTTRSGKPFSSVSYEKIEVNPSIDAEKFALKK